jgi:putative aldouronate transport system permease protein
MQRKAALRRTARRIQLTASDRVFLGIVYVIVGVFVLLVLYPLVYVINCSFSSPEALVAGRVFFWPVEPGLLGYEAVYKTSQVWVGYFNSIRYAVTGTVLSVLATMCAAFPLTRKEFPSKKVVTWFYAVTMFISGTLIPSYLLVKYLGMMDTMWALIIPGLTYAWAIIIGRTFIMSSIPEELFEAASADGCSYFRYLFMMVFPLSKAIIAVLALGYATGMWNSYFSALLYIDSPSKYPLQLILRNILISNTVDLAFLDQMTNVEDANRRRYMSELLKYALIVVSSAPLLIFYPFIQKYFIKGVMIGSIKG